MKFPNMIPWKFNSQVKLLTNPGSSEVQNHIHNKVKSCEAGQRSCLYKSWTSEVHLIPKYLTSLEVCCAWNLRSMKFNSKVQSCNETKICAQYLKLIFRLETAKWHKWTWKVSLLSCTKTKWSFTSSPSKVQVTDVLSSTSASKKILQQVSISFLHIGK